MLLAGGECFDDLATLGADQGLCRLLGSTPPAPDTMRRFLYTFDEPSLVAKAQAERAPDQEAYRVEDSAALCGLARVQSELVRRAVAGLGEHTATLDHDATIIESHKEEARPHYKHGRGYQPVAGLWAEADLVVADEFRDGNVPAGMENLPLIQRAFRCLPEPVTQRSFRADSACYDERILKWLAQEQRPDGPSGPSGFAIGADMTAPLRAQCERLPESAWQVVAERVDEVVCCADVEFAPGDWPKQAQPLRYVAVRIQPRQRDLFGSSYKYLAVVSNRWDLDGACLLRWYWQKAGTIEHLHDVTKNELGAGVLPCGRFGANAAWYRCSLMAYNLHTILKRRALAATLRQARPKRLRYACFQLAGRVVSHAGRLILRLASVVEDLTSFRAARRKLLHFALHST